MATLLILEPIFEADFEDCSYGFRPGRSAHQALEEIRGHLKAGYQAVYDADLKGYFDTIPHSDLLKSVARRIVDRHVLRLIKLWLKAPIEEKDGEGARRIVGGKSNTRGTPQGGVASPMLANIYMNRFLKHWRLTGSGEAFYAHVVSYADDFVILSRGRAAEALALIGNRSALRALREHANDNVLAGSLGPVGEIAQAAMEEIERPTRTRKKG